MSLHRVETRQLAPSSQHPDVIYIALPSSRGWTSTSPRQGLLPFLSSPSQTTSSPSGETNYLHRDSMLWTSHFNHWRHVIITDCAVVKRNAAFVANTTCLLVDQTTSSGLSTRRPPRRPGPSGVWRPTTLHPESVTLNPLIWDWQSTRLTD